MGGVLLSSWGLAAMPIPSSIPRAPETPSGIENYNFPKISSMTSHFLKVESATSLRKCHLEVQKSMVRAEVYSGSSFVLCLLLKCVLGLPTQAGVCEANSVGTLLFGAPVVLATCFLALQIY